MGKGGIAFCRDAFKGKIKTPIANYRIENIMINCTFKNPVATVPPSVEGGMRGCNFGFVFDCTKTKSMGNLQRGFDSLFPSPFPIGIPSEGEGQGRGHKTSDHLPSLRSVRQESAPLQTICRLLRICFLPARGRSSKLQRSFSRGELVLNLTQYYINHCKYLKITVYLSLF